MTYPTGGIAGEAPVHSSSIHQGPGPREGFLYVWTSKADLYFSTRPVICLLMLHSLPFHFAMYPFREEL